MRDTWLVLMMMGSFLLWTGCPTEDDDDVADDDVADDDSAGDDDTATDDDTSDPQSLSFVQGEGVPIESAETWAACVYDYSEADGMAEVVLANYAAENATWLYEAGAYTALEMTDSGLLSTDCLIGDFDDDGLEDELIINYSGVIHRERTANGYEVLALPGLTGAPLSVASGDVNGDGRMDVIVGTAGGSDVLWLQDVNGTFSDGGTIPSSYMQTQDIEIVDLNADGWADVAMASTDQCRLYSYNGTEFSLIYNAPLESFSGCHAVATGELNGDTTPDLVFACEGADMAFSTDGALGLTQLEGIPRLEDAEESRGVAIADFDLDGDDDILIARMGARDVLLLQDAPGTFTDATDLLPSFQDDSMDVVVADVDSDTDLDVVIAVNGQTRLLINQVFE
jgi:hypothetical protein